jgi:hypothetical protein
MNQIQRTTLASLARRILPYALVIVGLAAIFHVGDHMAVLPIECAYDNGVTFLKWPWERCRVGPIEGTPDFYAVAILNPDGSSTALQNPEWDRTWYWPYWRMSLVQAETLIALGIVWIALRKRETGS